MRSIVTVTSAAASINLTDLETVKTELGITDDSQDEQIEQWIAQASAIAATYCRRVFGEETVRETFRPEYNGYSCATYREFLPLSRTPVSSITSVTNDDGSVSASEYEYDSVKGHLYFLTNSVVSRWGFTQSVVVTYVAGYAEDDVPPDLERAVLSIIKDMRADANRDPNLIEKEIEGVARYRWWAPSDAKAVLPVEITGLLEPYVRRFGWMT
jgi:hypothetical protein